MRKRSGPLLVLIVNVAAANSAERKTAHRS